MVRRWLTFAVIAACTGAAPSPVLAGPRALLELFTSQGCSSCPAADQLLGQLITDPTLIAVSLPITVWDYLGWHDTLADPRYTSRWQGYSKARGDRQQYTPQVVVNGAAHAIGSDHAAIEKAIAKTHTNKAVMSVDVIAARAGDKLDITLPETGPVAPAAVSVLAIARAISVHITRGENRGRTITYYHVARRMLHLGPWTAASHHWTVALRDLASEGVESAAVLVQTGSVEKPNYMLGATMASLH
jgi:hypothetical protein